MAARLGSGLGRVMNMSGRCELADDKLLEEISGGRFADADHRIFKRQRQAVAIIRGIVEIGDAAAARLPRMDE